MLEIVELAKRIIQEQELVIGPLAWREAKKVKGLEIANGQNVVIRGESREVLADLVAQYEELFGPASREVCREAVRSLVSEFPANQIPSVLK